MSRLQVVVSTMNQNDFSLYKKMNVQTDMIICNQCNENKIEEIEIDGNKIIMISTTTRGLSKNRNIGMAFSEAEFCLVADDDITYLDGYEKIVCETFDKYKNADVVAFNYTSTGRAKMGKYTKKVKYTKKIFGSPRLAYRNIKIKSLGVSFSTIFGSGSIYTSGEDSLFFKSLYQKKAKVLRHTAEIGNIDYGESTWFHGYTEKYFFDKGAWVRAEYPKLWRLLKYYLILKEKKHSGFSFCRLVRIFNDGAKSYLKRISYETFLEKMNEKRNKKRSSTIK